MAANPDIGSMRKRKRSISNRRFGAGDQVEVKSEEDGFYGSWHPGTVIKCGSRLCHVRYNNFVTRNGVARHLTEKVKVFPFTNGNSECDYSRPIRLQPPPLDVGVCDLNYGLCVDVFHSDVWWEGVVFDLDDGTKERRVFFPDLGDEMTVQIDAIRITQDWSEISETWQRRGTWLFLELLEDKSLVLTASVKQIWYDVRLKEGFQKIRHWTSSKKDLWMELIKEVIDEQLIIFVRFVMQPISEIADTGSDSGLIAHKDSGKWIPVTPDMVPGAKFDPDAVTGYASGSSTRNGKHHSSFKTKVRMHLLYLGWKMEYKRDTTTRNPRFRYISPDGNLYHSLIQVCLALDGSTSQLEVPSSITQDGPKRLIGLPDDQSSFPLDAEFEENKETPSSITQDGPKRLIGLPDDQSSFPLDAEFQENKETPSSITQDGPKRLIALPGDQSSFPLDAEFRDNKETPSSITQDDSKSLIASPADQLPFPLDVESQENRDDFCFPEAVKEYYAAHGYNIKIKQKLKKHLSAMGWELHQVPMMAKGGKPRLAEHYYSPSGKWFYSLRTACRSCLNEEGIGSKQKTQVDQLSSLPKLKRRKVSEASIKTGDVSDGTRVMRSSKRVRQVVPPSASNHIPRTVLSWLIDNNAVLVRSKVFYRKGLCQLALAEGRITCNGIKCACCQEVFTPNKFGIHAVKGRNDECASANLFLKDGRSLLDCQKQVINTINLTRVNHDMMKGTRHQGENDDLCTVCHYGGELVLCDACPSAFHMGCLGLEDIPDGDWFCQSCCCRICRQCMLKEDADHLVDEAPNIIFKCDQCNKKYHHGCLMTQNIATSRRNDGDSWFCSKKCGEIFNGLHKLIGKSIPVGGENLTWTLLKPGWLDEHASDACVEALTEVYSKLSVALGVMHECFEPVKDPYTKRDLVEDVIFNRESALNRLNFQGFYTVLLERNDELITVASLRVYGSEVAEIPLIGTRFQHRRNGMCRILMNELEKKLEEVGVERLVLPAVPSVLNTWTTSFGYSKMTKSERYNFLGYNFLDFQDTLMCQKLLKNESSPESSLTGQARPVTHGDCCINGIDGSSDVFEAEPIEGETPDQGPILMCYERKRKRCASVG